MPGILQMMLASAGAVRLFPIVVTHDVNDPADAEAGFRVHSDGTVDTDQGGVFTDFYQWLIAGAAADFEVRLDIISGTLTSGTVATWLACSTTRTWTLEKTVAGNAEVQATLSLRRAGGTLAIASTNVDLIAEVNA